MTRFNEVLLPDTAARGKNTVTQYVTSFMLTKMHGTLTLSAVFSVDRILIFRGSSLFSGIGFTFTGAY
jgi:hypothetical protein